MSNPNSVSKISGVIGYEVKDAVRAFISDSSNEFKSETDLLRQLLDFWLKNDKLIPSTLDIQKIAGYNKLSTELDSVKKKLEDEITSSRNKDQKIKELTELSSTRHTTITQLEESLAEYKGKVTKLESELKNSNQENDKLSKTYNELDAKYKLLFSEKEKINGQLEQANSINAKNAESIQSHNQQISEFEEQLATHNKIVSDYQTQLANKNKNVLIIFIIALISVVATVLVNGGWNFIVELIQQ
jgi:DNA repair exonuclease SbcCD ATPase subunit